MQRVVKRLFLSLVSLLHNSSMPFEPIRQNCFWTAQTEFVLNNQAKIDNVVHLMKKRLSWNIKLFCKIKEYEHNIMFLIRKTLIRKSFPLVWIGFNLKTWTTCPNWIALPGYFVFKVMKVMKQSFEQWSLCFYLCSTKINPLRIYSKCICI